SPLDTSQLVSALKERCLGSMSRDSDDELISNLEVVIRNLRDHGVYNDEDKRILSTFIKEYVTGDRPRLDPDILRYLFTGWFVVEGLKVRDRPLDSKTGPNP